MLLSHTIIRGTKFVSYSSVNITYLLACFLTYLPKVIWTIKLEILYLIVPVLAHNRPLYNNNNEKNGVV